METVEVGVIPPEQAARLLSGVEARDPRGITGPADLREQCASGLCFGVTVGGAVRGVYVLAVRNGQAFIRWARGDGAGVDLTRNVLPLIEQQCGQLRELAFQTSRPGLVRKATEQGYEVTGWILRKKLK